MALADLRAMLRYAYVEDRELFVAARNTPHEREAYALPLDASG